MFIGRDHVQKIIWLKDPSAEAAEQKRIGATIGFGQKILCLQYVGFLILINSVPLKIFQNAW